MNEYFLPRAEHVSLRSLSLDLSSYGATSQGREQEEEEEERVASASKFDAQVLKRGA